MLGSWGRCVCCWEVALAGDKAALEGCVPSPWLSCCLLPGVSPPADPSSLVESEAGATCSGDQKLSLRLHFAWGQALCQWLLSGHHADLTSPRQGHGLPGYPSGWTLHALDLLVPTGPKASICQINQHCP